MMDQRLSILQHYTSDKDKVAAAVDKATAASYSLYTDESDRIAKELEISSAQGTAGSGVAPTGAGGQTGSLVQAAMAQMTLQMLQFADTADRNQQGQAQLFGLAAMIREQKRLPGRKTLLYFTGGLNIPPNVTITSKLWLRMQTEPMSPCTPSTPTVSARPTRIAPAPEC